MEEARKAREEEIKTINRINHRMDYQANRRGRGRVRGRGYGNSNNWNQNQNYPRGNQWYSNNRDQSITKRKDLDNTSMEIRGRDSSIHL